MDMQKDLVKIRQSYAEITATLKRMEKQKETATRAAEDWYKRAQLALEKGTCVLNSV
jgi:phage shock protein A